MTYARLEDSFRRNPKIARLARTLGVRRAEARGLLAGLWSELLTQAPDGDLRSFDDAEIEEFADWEGSPGELARALQDERHRFLDRLRGRLVVHDWADYAEGLKRAAWKRAERLRKRHVSRDSRADVAEEERGSDLIRDEMIRDEMRDARAREGAPSDAPDAGRLAEAVAEAWDRTASHVSLPRVARPVSSRLIKLISDRIGSDPVRADIAWWEALVRRAHAAQFLTAKKQPPTTLEWLVSREQHITRLLGGEFDRDFADERRSRSRSSVRRNPGPTMPPVSAPAAPATPGPTEQPREEPELLKRLKALAGATSPAAGEGS